MVNSYQSAIRHFRCACLWQPWHPWTRNFRPFKLAIFCKNMPLIETTTFQSTGYKTFLPDTRRRTCRAASDLTFLTTWAIFIASVLRTTADFAKQENERNGNTNFCKISAIPAWIRTWANTRDKKYQEIHGISFESWSSQGSTKEAWKSTENTAFVRKKKLRTLQSQLFPNVLQIPVNFNSGFGPFPLNLLWLWQMVRPYTTNKWLAWMIEPGVTVVVNKTITQWYIWSHAKFNQRAVTFRSAARARLYFDLCSLVGCPPKGFFAPALQGALVGWCVILYSILNSPQAFSLSSQRICRDSSLVQIFSNSNLSTGPINRMPSFLIFGS